MFDGLLPVELHSYWKQHLDSDWLFALWLMDSRKLPQKVFEESEWDGFLKLSDSLVNCQENVWQILQIYNETYK